jgi:hypothetical protein
MESLVFVVTVTKKNFVNLEKFSNLVLHFQLSA